ncbi:hypothetical protein ACFSRY_01435 [Pontibacter locisalis]|uniref:Cytochrome C and Quinol oxidase polypeptide I n=1 Tax=Pontibacter locisalis TaxID=1719035 RepID=A0ABW5IH20_9BACT
MSTASVSNSPAKWVVLPHYAFAALSFVVLSMLLLFSTDAFNGHYFHPKLLTLTHVAVLGWATMIIFGALYQLLPVILDCRLFSERLAAYTFLLLGAGTGILAYSFWHFQVGWTMHLSACLLFMAFLLFNLNIIQTARRAPKWTIEADFIVTSSIWLLITGLVGLLMALNFTFAFLPEEHVHYLKLHAHIGMVGWFLLLIIGVGAKLIPMFLLMHPKGPQKLNWAYNLINGGLVLFVFDHMLLRLGASLLCAGLVAGGLLLFLLYLIEAVGTMQRKDMELGVKQTFVALALLLLPLVLVIFVSGDFGISQQIMSSVYLVYGISVFLGFVTALILGQTFKTLPFIVWMHVYETHVGKCKTPLPKDLYNHHLLWWQNICYLVGLLGLICGVMLGQESIILAGAIAFTLTSVLYTVNVFQILLHKARDLKPFTYGKAGV